MKEVDVVLLLGKKVSGFKLPTINQDIVSDVRIQNMFITVPLNLIPILSLMFLYFTSRDYTIVNKSINLRN